MWCGDAPARVLNDGEDGPKLPLVVQSVAAPQLYETSHSLQAQKLKVRTLASCGQSRLYCRRRK